MERLRHVTFDGFRLATWDTGKRTCQVGSSPTHSTIAYALWDNSGELLFHGADVGISNYSCIDDASLRTVIGFLTLRPGDTESDYFEAYTERQLEFADSMECESLQIWAMEPDGDELEALEFQEVE